VNGEKKLFPLLMALSEGWKKGISIRFSRVSVRVQAVILRAFERAIGR